MRGPFSFLVQVLYEMLMPRHSARSDQKCGPFRLSIIVSI
jgi:hypothetical protein